MTVECLLLKSTKIRVFFFLKKKTDSRINRRTHKSVAFLYRKAASEKEAGRFLEGCHANM